MISLIIYLYFSYVFMAVFLHMMYDEDFKNYDKWTYISFIFAPLILPLVIAGLITENNLNN